MWKVRAYWKQRDERGRTVMRWAEWSCRKHSQAQHYAAELLNLAKPPHVVNVASEHPVYDADEHLFMGVGYTAHQELDPDRMTAADYAERAIQDLDETVISKREAMARLAKQVAIDRALATETMIEKIHGEDPSAGE